MKRKFIVGAVVVLCVVGFISLFLYLKHEDELNRRIEVVLADDMTLEFGHKKKVSEFITSINGKIMDDFEVSFDSIGKQDVVLEFINDRNRKLKYTFEIDVIDTVEPLIWLSNHYSLAVDSEYDWVGSILCGDNYDAKPRCFVEGNYDVHTVGDYSLIFKAVDSSGNVEQQPFILHVYEPDFDSKPSDLEPSYTAFSEVIHNYKNDQNQIGIDVSSWQGDIDFEQLKQSGVEFIIIRVGSRMGPDEDFFVDSKFKQNMEGAKKYNIPVGLYFYSYATSVEDARKEAQWVLKQIKGYDIDLPIAFDWEEWRYFNSYEVSFFGLTSMAEAFLEEIEKAGYTGMLYSSKTYLEHVWFPMEYPVWLAHYTDETNYEGDYRFWQMMNSGRVAGIEGDVDINIYYPNE